MAEQYWRPELSGWHATPLDNEASIDRDGLLPKFVWTTAAPDPMDEGIGGQDVLSGV